MFPLKERKKKIIGRVFLLKKLKSRPVLPM
jgi:hypothetical protein